LSYRGGAWGAGDLIIFATTRGPIYKVPAGGGDPQLYLPLDADKELDFHDPSFLPDGRTLLYSVHRLQGVDTLELYKDGTRKVLFRLQGVARPQSPQLLNAPQYSSTGHIIYRREQGIEGVWAVPFSLSSNELTGEHFLVVATGDTPSVSSDGTSFANGHRVAGLSSTRMGEPRWQRRRACWTSASWSLILQFPRMAEESLMLLKTMLERFGCTTQSQKTNCLTLSSSTRENSYPSWIPGQNRIAFSCVTQEGPAVCAKGADGKGATDILAKQGEVPVFSPDGAYMVYIRSGEGPGLLMKLGLTKDSQPEMLSDVAAINPRLSPDGHYLSYYSWERGGRSYIRTFPTGDAKWEVPSAEGDLVVWHPNGKGLFYEMINPSTLMAAPLETSPSFSIGTPRKICDVGSNQALGFDITPDGSKLVVVRHPSEAGPAPPIIVIQNWFAEFKDKQKK
jgi:hypothetical protein